MEVLEVKPVLATLYPLIIAHGMEWVQNCPSAMTGLTKMSTGD
jgi:hypothetical protein